MSKARSWRTPARSHPFLKFWNIPKPSLIYMVFKTGDSKCCWWEDRQDVLWNTVSELRGQRVYHPMVVKRAEV